MPLPMARNPPPHVERRHSSTSAAPRATSFLHVRRISTSAVYRVPPIQSSPSSRTYFLCHLERSLRSRRACPEYSRRDPGFRPRVTATSLPERPNARPILCLFLWSSCHSRARKNPGVHLLCLPCQSGRGYSESDQGFVDCFGGFGRWVLAMRVGAEDQGYDAAY